MPFNKDEIKQNLTLEEIAEIVESLGGEPEIKEDSLVAKTICHDGDSHKLYYYENTQLFQCYTQCGSFDIFDLVSKVKGLSLTQSIFYVVNSFNMHQYFYVEDAGETLEDWKIFHDYAKIAEINATTEEIVLKEYEDVLQFYPSPSILGWESEGITKDVCNYMGIKYNPTSGGVLIPHKDQNGRLVGIRERTLVKDNETFGKYRPAKINNVLYNHPLAFNLYGLDKAKENIKMMETAIVVEAEKSVLKYMSYFGTANNICVAVCGSNLNRYQVQLLLNLGVKEICIGFDKDFEELHDENYNAVTKKLNKLYEKYCGYVKISFLFDKVNDQLGYKESPLDAGSEKFMYLWRNRLII